MDNNNSNLKLSPTGGLKIMTVFVVVLVAHVIVLGGITAYYLLKSPSAETDQMADKAHKPAKTDGSLASDGQMPTDSSATASAPQSPLTPPADGTTPSAGTDSTTPEPATTSPNMLTQIPLRTGPVGPVINPSSPLAQNTPLMSETTEPAFVPVPSTAPATATTIAPDLAPPPDSVSAATPYVVKSHDSLAKIARQNHTTVASLKSSNSLSSDMLKIGQKLVIPAKTPAATTVAATTPDASATAASLTEPATTPTIAGTTLAKVTAKTPAATTPKVAAKTPATPAQATSTVASTATHSHVYTVVKGDTLTKIAHKFKTTPSVLMAENNITDATKLSIGKKLKIPAKETRAATATEPATQPAEVQAKSGVPASTATSLATAKTSVKTATKTIAAATTTVVDAPDKPLVTTKTANKTIASNVSAVDQVQSSLSAPTPTTMGNPEQTQIKSQASSGEYANYVP